MMDFDGSPQADLITSAARAVGPEALFERVLAALSPTLDAGLLVLLPVAARSILARWSGPGWVSGAGILREILGGDWQTLLGLPDALAQAAAVPVALRVAIAEAVLERAAAVCDEEARRLDALTDDCANETLPPGWDAIPQEPAQ